MHRDVTPLSVGRKVYLVYFTGYSDCHDDTQREKEREKKEKE